VPVLRPEDLYHTGIVVPELDRAMADLARLAGYRWMRPLAVELDVWSPAGPGRVALRFAYSLHPPYLELVTEVPGTAWAAAPGNAVHHVGYWVDDIAAASAALADDDRPLEVCGGTDPASPATFAYHRGPDGIRIELVDRTVMGDFGAFLAANGEATPAG